MGCACSKDTGDEKKPLLQVEKSGSAPSSTSISSGRQPSEPASVRKQPSSPSTTTGTSSSQTNSPSLPPPSPVKTLASPKFCVMCGTMLHVNAKFCSTCGRKVTDGSSAGSTSLPPTSTPSSAVVPTSPPVSKRPHEVEARADVETKRTKNLIEEQKELQRKRAEEEQQRKKQAEERRKRREQEDKEQTKQQVAGPSSVTSPSSTSTIPSSVAKVSQVRNQPVGPSVKPKGPKAALLEWCKNSTDGYKDVNVINFTTSWADGLAFCALIHKFNPSLIPFETLSKSNAEQNLKLAFDVAEKQLGVPQLLDVEDVLEFQEELSMITYISSIYNVIKKGK